MIKIKNLTRSFNSHVAVDSISLDIPRGAMYGFLGPNGAGKTTTLRMLMGLLNPTSGSATVDGIDVTADPVAVRARVGYLPDEIFLYDYLTGYQFLEFLADVHNVPAEEKSARIGSLLELFGMTGVAGDYTANYSFGMKKKIALAGIVIHSPPLLILDEPFNGLDPQASRDFRVLLEQMVKSGTTVIFSSHVLEVVEKLVTHAGIISKGKICVSATIDSLIASYGSLEKAFFTLTT
ncbi:MAG: ABC transporter ATP-binding protein [Candidatus Riflebacteria bacterium]|nr:ABC transporter ATP-binding protein [Candidatus Riflebacteria bacterium]